MIKECSKKYQHVEDDEETLVICDDLREYYKFVNYISIKPKDFVFCPYCGFYLKT